MKYLLFEGNCCKECSRHDVFMLCSFTELFILGWREGKISLWEGDNSA